VQVTRHTQLYRSSKLTGYGTQKSVSYEVQPTSEQERAKRIREVRKCQKATGYMITLGRSFCWMVCCHVSETLPRISHMVLSLITWDSQKNWMFWFELDETGSCLLPQHWFSACSEKRKEFWGCCWLSPCRSSKLIITPPPALQLHSWVMTVFWCSCWWKLLLAVIFLWQNFARFWPQKFKRVCSVSNSLCFKKKIHQNFEKNLFIEKV
jgi:hypothetical protein